MDQQIINDQLAEALGEETGKIDRLLKNVSDDINTRQSNEFDMKHFGDLRDRVANLGQDLIDLCSTTFLTTSKNKIQFLILSQQD